MGLAFVCFVSLFAMDVFEENQGFWKTVLALARHLVPSGIILIALVIAWRWEWLGAILFVALGALYLLLFWGRFPWTVYLVMSGPLFLMGILFPLGWVRRRALYRDNLNRGVS